MLRREIPEGFPSAAGAYASLGAKQEKRRPRCQLFQTEVNNVADLSGVRDPSCAPSSRCVDNF